MVIATALHIPSALISDIYRGGVLIASWLKLYEEFVVTFNLCHIKMKMAKGI